MEMRINKIFILSRPIALSQSASIFTYVCLLSVSVSFSDGKRQGGIGRGGMVKALA